MPKKKLTKAEKERLLEQERRCWDLRVAGLEFDEIAEAMTANGHKMSTATAYRRVQAAYGRKSEALKEEVDQRVELYRAQINTNIARLNALLTDKNAKLKPNEFVAINEEIRKSNESLRKLDGTDARKGVDVTSGGEPMCGIVGVDLSKI